MRWPKNRTRNKYGAVKTDRGFPSKLESAVYDLLMLHQRAGEIDDIKRQVSVVLIDGPREEKITYRVDFSYYSKQDKCVIYVEAKGMETDVWKLKIKLWRKFGPGPLEIYKGNYSRPTLIERIEPLIAP